MNNIKSFIEKYVTMPAEDWELIESMFKRVVYKKNEAIVTEGEVCKYFYFIEEGLVRNFVNNNKQEITKFFIAAPYCMTSRMSFINQTPTKDNAQTIERSVIWQITLDEYNELIKLDSWRLFTRKMLNEAQDFIEQRLIESMTETAEVRYYRMQRETPDLVNRIPQKYLASYLGIATQSLSRIRKNALKNDN
ncbi:MULTISPECIES: Crp/Fnr family transcriptional regulator [Aestuariibaculum]|uniref:Crp/Fnr family transcriptional regulator n=1 Tax=Aestuariibaculum lutulentum TaxID=2920935 RepID=A0ABS9RIT2_9FLAO|nr:MULTISPECIES: Crp/Fnr family transcriptional regulator [Aestuariibaculum]MCH4552787.1 Crp/Fnr family transcriptional regulator [Aestuariibaculum lutulentum]MCR8669328.1 Crp/Fnr family transcriptional regulator [Aestuariibaculum sp. M13]